MIKAVVFDMDGIMFDTEKVCQMSWDTVGEEMGIGKAGYMVYKTLGMTAETAIKILQNEFGENFDAKEFKKRGRECSYKYFNDFGVPEKPYLHETLDALKADGYKLAVASSTSSDSVFHHLNEKNITHYFDKVICGDMIKNSKPAPDIYLKACEELSEKAEECVAVEDSKNGILSAWGAKMNVIMIPDLWQGDKETDKKLLAKLNNLAEISPFLKQNENK